MDAQTTLPRPVDPVQAGREIAQGEVKKPMGGRPVGSVNLTTRYVREKIAALADKGADKVWEWLEEVEDPAKRVELFLRAIEYHIPKLARTEVTGADGGPQQHTYRWLADGEEDRGRVIDVTQDATQPGADHR